MSLAILAAILVVLVVLVATQPLHYILGFSLLLVAVPADAWQIGGVFFDKTDLALAAVGVSLIARGRPTNGPLKIPYFGLWVLLALLFSLSYLTSIYNREYLTDPVRITYQLYRYALKPILFYPLAALFLSAARPTRSTIYVVLGAGVLCALQSIPQGYSGMRANGPLETGNVLGAVLVVPIVFTFTLMIASRGSTKRRALLAACMLVLLRGLLFSGSRGALASALAGVGTSAFFLYSIPSLRSSVVRFLLPVGLVMLFILLIPGIADRPSIQRALSLAEGSGASTFEWRVQNRWIYFLDQAIEEPFLGTGRAVDPALGSRGNTPHSGYIALAVKRGFPALAVFVIFALIAIRDSIQLIRDPRPNPWGPLTGVLCLACTAGLLVHNIVESNFEAAFPSKVFWIYVALPLVARQAMQRAKAPALRLSRAPRHRQLQAATPVDSPH